jgi:hypothetical protein
MGLSGQVKLWTRRKRDMAQYVARSFSEARRLAPDMQSLEAYCLFLGYERSGHTLLASIFNAHRNAVVSNELHALSYLPLGITRQQLFAMIVMRDQRWGAHGWRWTNYGYAVPGQWQGRYETLKVIGDKEANRSSVVLRRWPGRLVTLRRTVELPLRVIHHVRNPYDNIATIARRYRRPLTWAAARYLPTVPGNVNLLRQHIDREEQIESHHEDLVADPRHELTRLLTFLGLEPAPDYLDACCAIVHTEPRRSRFEVDWPGEVRDAVAREIDKHEHLRRYSFELT